MINCFLNILQVVHSMSGESGKVTVAIDLCIETEPARMITLNFHVMEGLRIPFQSSVKTRPAQSGVHSLSVPMEHKQEREFVPMNHFDATMKLIHVHV